MSAKPEPPAPSAPGVHPKPFWSFRPRSDREAGDAVVSNFLLHWFPAKTYKPSLDWNYSFWLGTASADAIYGCVAAFGVTAVSDFLLGSQFWLRLVGGLFLLYLGCATFRSVPAHEAAPVPVRDFRHSRAS